MRLTSRFATTIIIATIALASLQTTFASAQIAPGVTQSAAHTANITGVVSSSTGAPVAGADIRLTGTSVRSTKTETNGSFSFQSVPWGIYEITVTSSLGMASRGNIVLNGDVNVAIQYQAHSTLQTIAHVATSSAGAHINVTSSRIDSINPSEYAFQGNATWQKLFAQIPGVAASGYTQGGEEEFNSIAGSPMAPVALSLNGALPYETSTTLDGMPLQGVSASMFYLEAGGGVDLSTLPLGAFDTADVVRGPGANAPSIVDSLGGSFVLHGPEPVQKDSFEFSVSNDPYGGIISNARVNLRFGGLSATLIYDINNSPGPLGTSDVLYGDSYATAINGSLVQSSVYSYPNPGQGVPNCYCSFATTLLACCVPQSTAWADHGGAVDLSYNVGRSVTAEVFYAGQQDSQQIIYGYYPFSFNPSATSPPYGGSYAPSAPGQSYWLLYSFPNDFTTAASNLLEEKVTAYLGNGVLRVAALQHNSFTAFDEDGPANGNYVLYGTANVGASFPGTPTAYNGTVNDVTFLGASYHEGWWSNNRDLLASYALQISPDLSVGLSQTDSYYNMPWYDNGYIGGAEYFSEGNTTSVSAATGETRTHIDFEPSDEFSLGLSWYWTRSDYHVPLASNANEYNDTFFSYNAPRFGATWRPSRNISVRLAAGGGYALPYLYDLIGSPPALSGTYYAESKANSSLQPEKSFGYDIGTDLRLEHFTILSFDAYQTNLYGQVFSSLTQNSTYLGLPLYITQFGNLAASRFEGINLTVNHVAPTGWYWKGTFGLTRGYVVSVPSGFYNSAGCTNCANQTVIPGPNFNGSFTAAVPYASASALLGYRWKPGTYFDLSPTYYGNNNIYYEPAFVALDGQASYALSPHFSLIATLQNINGVYDRSVQYARVGYAYPTIQGASGYYVGGALEEPYGPRAILLTVNYK